MSTANPKRWAEISPYLDQALTLLGEDRDRWLAALREENPALAEELRTLLEEHESIKSEGFLEGGLPTTLTGAELAGQTLGAYRLIEPLAEGGMSTVWVADRCDGHFEGRVAIKFLNVALVGQAGHARFIREGSILGRLRHPHIAQLMDAGISPTGRPYLVLEYIEGEAIDEYCDRNELSLRARLRLFLDVLAAVAFAHVHLVVHRDLKPPNVLVSKDGEVKLLDFGIAKLLENEEQPAAATLLTRESGSALTPQYAAPEQLTGAVITTATDVYALGVLLYVLLTGKHPAGSAVRSPAGLIKAIVETEPQRPSDVVVSRDGTADYGTNAARRAATPEKLHRLLRGDLDTIAMKALKKKPQERYPSISAFADDIERYLRTDPIAARPDTLRYRTAKFVRRNRTAVILAFLAVGGVIAGAIGTLIQARAAGRERDFAVAQLSRAEAVNDLNRFLLSDAAPSGTPFTIKDLLARAEHIVQQRRSGNDKDRVELLISIGDEYSDVGEAARARSVLAQAYELSRSVPDHALRAKAACALGGALVYVGNINAGEALFQEGIAEVPSGEQNTLDRVFCLLRGGNIARERGSHVDALARVEEAERDLQQAVVSPESLQLNALMDLAVSYRLAGRLPEAITAFEQASKRLSDSGREDTRTAVLLLDSRGVTLLDAGRPLDAEAVLDRAISISRTDNQDRDVPSWLLRDYSAALRVEGKLERAVDQGQRAYRRAQQEGAETVADTALLQLGMTYQQQGDFAHAEAALNDAATRLRLHLPTANYVSAIVLWQRALIAKGRGDARSALDLVDRSLTDLNSVVRAGNRGSQYVPRFLISKADIELDLGQYSEAAADANHAITFLEPVSRMAQGSVDVGHGYLVLGRALQATGKRAEAKRAFDTAVEQLEHSVGPDHPDTRAAHQLAQETSALPVGDSH